MLLNDSMYMQAWDGPQAFVLVHHQVVMVVERPTVEMQRKSRWFPFRERLQPLFSCAAWG